MSSSVSLAEKVLFISGGSRGIGRCIALRAARDGAKVVLAAKTKEPNPTLPGTIYTVAEEIEEAGGEALPCVVDIRSEEQVNEALRKALERFGGIDILVNNASTISLSNTASTTMNSYDLMMDVNARGTFLCSKLCIPLLQQSSNPHILNVSPPLSMSPRWFHNHLSYSMSKYGMSMCVLGMAKELHPLHIAVNALWPRTAIDTVATQMIGGEAFADRCRIPEIVADAAHAILTKTSSDVKNTGNFFIDEDVLRAEGVANFDKYSVKPGAELITDFFLDDDPVQSKPRVPNVSVEDVFRRIKGLLSPELTKRVNAIFHFKLSGSEPGIWFLDLKRGNGCAGRATQGVPHDHYDCHFELTSEEFIEMFCGQLLPTQAFIAGSMHIRGNLFAAVRLEHELKKIPL